MSADHGAITKTRQKGYVVGLDFGTASVRALMVGVADGEEVAVAEYTYPHGEGGVIGSGSDADLARQHPEDYVTGLRTVLAGVTAAAEARGVASEHVVGIGVDATSSTIVPLDDRLRPMCRHRSFCDSPSAMAWLWKDHTAHRESERITESAGVDRTIGDRLALLGGRSSAEWFWPKVWHAAEEDPTLFAATAIWLEVADWIPALLGGIEGPEKVVRNSSAAGHKAMFTRSMGGFPSVSTVTALSPALARVARGLPETVAPVGTVAACLGKDWARMTGLRPGTPISAGSIDAHAAGPGAHIRPGRMVKILGTSSCDLVVLPTDWEVTAIPGVAGVVRDSIIPGMWSVEAGQSAVGDMYDWVSRLTGRSQRELTEAATEISPGSTGLLMLDWVNGNRSILADQRLSAVAVGLTITTTPAQLYRAAIEATAFGARTIVEHIASYGIPIDEIVVTGGIAKKNPLVMQILADVLGMPMSTAATTQGSALGSAIAAAVAAGAAAGGWDTFEDAMEAMTHASPESFVPRVDSCAMYDTLYREYRLIHDRYGSASEQDDEGLIKRLLAMRDKRRR